jgi:Tol biopolymer transport system component
VPPIRLDPGGAFQPGVGLGPLVGAGNRVVYTAEQDAEDSVEVFSVPLLGGTQVKLNGSFAKLDLGDVAEYVLTPSGDRVVYLADADRPDSLELYVIAADGSQAPIRLNDPTPTEEHTVQGPIQISPDGTQVLFRYGIDPINPALDSDFDLYIAPLDGSSSQRRLNQTLSPNEELRYGTGFTPDSSRVFYHIYSSITVTADLWSVPADESAAPVRLVDILQPGGFLIDFAFTPDASTMVYRAEQEVDFRFDLYAVPVDGSAPPTRLSDFQYPTNGDVNEWHLTPDGQAVVFRANLDSIVRREIYRRPVDASAPATLLSIHTNPDYSCGARIVLSADGTIVAYSADGDTDGVTEVYQVPVDGSQLPLRLAGPQVAGGTAGLPQIDPTQTYVIFRGDVDVDQRFELYSVPLDGSALPTKLNPPIAGGRDVEIRFTISPDGSRVVYRMDGDLNNQIELYSAPIDGSSPSVKLNRPFTDANADVADFIKLTRDGTQVVFRANPSPVVDELFSAPIDGSRPARRLNRSIGFGQDVYSFEIVPDGSAVIFHADQETPGVDELFRSSLGRRIRREADPKASVSLQR